MTPGPRAPPRPGRVFMLLWYHNNVGWTTPPTRSRDHPVRGHMRELPNMGRLTIYDFHTGIRQTITKLSTYCSWPRVPLVKLLKSEIRSKIICNFRTVVLLQHLFEKRRKKVRKNSLAPIRGL